MAIRIIITGGTFDKAYDALRGELRFQDSHLPQILTHLNWTIPIELEITQLKDSLDMVDSDRERILQSVLRSEQDLIIITHGTDSMTISADYLLRQLEGNTEKTLVLTGAMLPYSLKNSDALFNLGTAAAAVQLLPPGVYIAMNGRVFPAGKVRKNRELGSFEGESFLWPLDLP